MTDGKRRREFLDALLPVIRQAGAAVMAIYATDFRVSEKVDASPVTEADRQAESIITAALRKLTPDVPIVAEEAVADGHVPAVGDVFWLVDPLDGTREFISRNGEFTINVALIEEGEPVLGLVSAPARRRLYGGVKGQGAFVERAGERHPIACRTPGAEGLTAVASRSHGDVTALEKFIKRHNVRRLINAGSSLKFCLVASGEADVYPRFGRTMEWDVAAGHAVLAAAGGHIRDAEEGRLVYGKPGFTNPHFVAWGGSARPVGEQTKAGA